MGEYMYLGKNGLRELCQDTHGGPNHVMLPGQVDSVCQQRLVRSVLHKPYAHLIDTTMD